MTLNVLKYIKTVFQNARGVRILKCNVDERGRKIVVFQSLGSHKVYKIYDRP